MPPPASPPCVIIVGGGPAGLAAAEVLLDAGMVVDLYDAMPSVGRKFLMAGKGGMNITHSEALPAFLSRYGNKQAVLKNMISQHSPEVLCDWIHGLGIETFVGTSGRVFPKEMKAAPLLRAWLHRLRDAGLRIHVRHRWLGWDNNGLLNFETSEGTIQKRADAVILALGGGSWSKLGSDGSWVVPLNERGIEIAPLKPANCGFDIGWSEHFNSRFAGEPVKHVAAWSANGKPRMGEFLVTESGIEGNLIYALSAPLREAIEKQGYATLMIDLLPNHDLARVTTEVAHPRGSRSLSSHLQSRLGIKGIKSGLLREVLSTAEFHDPMLLAARIKALPLKLIRPRPIDEAISTAGGVCFEDLDEQLMVRAHPGLFCAGEMLDWEAPTGGYLLTACIATGRTAAAGVLSWLHH